MTGESAWMEKLTPEFVQKAKEELRETPEVRKQAIEELRKLLNAEPDFHPPRDEAFLVRFLRAKKYNVERAFQTIRNYYTFQAKYSGVLAGFTPLQVAHVLEMNHIFVLPTRHHSGAAIGIFKMGSFDIEKVTAEELFATMMVSMEVAIEPEATQVCGYVLVFDMSMLNMRKVHHYAKPSLIYNFAKVAQDCAPYRLKAFHVVHEPFYCSILYNIFKTFISEKLSKRIYFHGDNMKSLHQHVPSELLTIEYDGELGSSVKYAKDFNSRLMSRESLFQKKKEYGYLEKKFHFL